METRYLRQILLASLLVMTASAQSTVAGTGTGAASMEGGLAAEKRGDWKAAFLLLSPLAQQGNPVAQLHLGYMWETGKAGHIDVSLATQWYQLSALQGNAQAQVNYGKMQKRVIDAHLSKPVFGDAIDWEAAYAEAVMPWLRKSADQGNSDGQYALGYMYYEGSKGVPQDYVEAAKWFRKSAAQGDEHSQYMLGVMYYDDRQGVPQDYAEALKWFKQSADQGYADGKKAFATLFIIKSKLAAKKDVGQTVCLPSDDPLGPPSVYG